MPGIIVDGVDGNEALNGSETSHMKENLSLPKSSQSPQSEGIDLPVEGCVNTSIEQLYDNVCELESSGDGSPSQDSYGSEGDESRIDSELRHLVGGDMKVAEIMEDEEEGSTNVVVVDAGNGSSSLKSEKGNKIQSPSKSSISSKKSKRANRSQLESDASTRASPKSKVSHGKADSIVSKRGINHVKKQENSSPGEDKLQNGNENSLEAGLENKDLGSFWLKHARELISSDNPRRALKYALKAVKSFEKRTAGKPSLDLVMSLHVVAAIHCSLGQYGQAIPALEQSIGIPILEHGQDHALAKFSGYMQLGDTFAMLGQVESSLQCYSKGLEIQKQTLGDMDPRVGETCRYLAEAHVQALQFDEAEKLCHMALDIHKENGAPSSLDETADRRLMGLICDTKGDHEAALEHLVLASMAMASNGQEIDVAAVDCSIGDAYLALARYDEAIFAYQKAATIFKSIKGESHPTVASVFVRLADLYLKIGKLKESRSYCENALKIYGKPLPGTTPEEIASGLTDVSALYESMNEHEEALKLLKRALKIYNNAPGQQNTIAGIEAQMGVLYYITGNYTESYASFKNAVTTLRACGEKKSAFFGIALNQMGLACVQRYAINEAADLFEEARVVLEHEYGPYHPDTLGVYSNLAGTYDAMGRLDEAIEILEYVVGIREEKLGTANPDVDDEKRRLSELLKEAGRVRNRKARSLEALLDTNPHIIKKDAITA
ncbi:putative tetratricopeptide-like helical domain superfamily [Dioscorea sansibarensis]